MYREFYDKHKGDPNASYTVRFLPYILKLVANKLKTAKTYDYERALSVALLASVEAERKFKQGNFANYIKKRVEGAITDEFRTHSKRDEIVRKKIEAFVQAYEKEHKAFPSQKVMLNALGITRAQYILFVKNQDKQQVSSLETVEPTSPSLEVDTFTEGMNKVLFSFDNTTNEIIKLKFIEELSDKQICSNLKLSSKEYQEILEETLPELRRRLTASGFDLEHYYELMSK